jgi:hypothetical protein
MNKIYLKIILVLILVFICGTTNAVMDTLAHHYSVSIFANLDTQFWDGTVSWCNKWKNCEAGNEAFLFSSSVFSFLTDGWHLAKFMYLLCVNIPIAILLFQVVKPLFYVPKFTPKLILFTACFVIVKVVQAAAFTLFYNYLLLK